MKNHLELFSGTHSFGKVSCKKYNVVSLDMNLDEKCPFTDYVSKNHIKEDIMTWDYKNYKIKNFDLITASPVCLWWSTLRNTWIGRKLKAHGDKIITKEILQEDIDKYGKPMVDKVIEIIEYFKPKYWIIENPQTGKMKHYIKEKYPNYNIFYDFDYCKYSNFGYKKRSRFWTNIKDIKPLLCKNDCENMLFINNQKIHKERMGTSKTVIDNEKIIRVNTKKKREKYKDFENIQQKSKLHKISLGSWGKKGTSQIGIGGGNNRLERYRIPEKLIECLLEKT